MQSSIFTILFFIVSCTVAFAQTPVIDSLLNQLPRTRNAEKVRVLNELCSEFSFVRPSQALLYGSQALDMAKNLNNPVLLSESANALGVMYAVQGDYEKALQHFLQSLAQAERAKAFDKIAGLYSNIAGVYKSQGDYRQALVYLKKAYEIDTRRKDPKAVSYWINAGILHKDLNQLDSALFCYETRLAIAKAENDDEYIARVSYNMGNVYALKAEPATATRFFEQTLLYAQKAGKQAFEAKALAGLAETYVGIRNYRLAEEYATRTLELSVRENMKETQEVALRILSACAAESNSFKEAFAYQKQYNILKDSIASESRRKAMAEMQVRFETRLKEQELSELKYQSQAQRRLLWLVSVASAVLVATLWLLFRQKQLRNRLLQQEKKQLLAEEQIYKLQQEKMQADLDFKNRELATTALHLSQKNDLLHKVGEELESQGRAAADTKKLRSLIKNSLDFDNAWKNFRLHFEEVHPQFFARLEQDFPDLSPNELKLCGYVKINLSNKQIAQLLNINPSSVDMSRYRLRKKLNLEADTQLNDFLRNY